MGIVVRAWASWSVVQVQLRSCSLLQRECLFFCWLHCSCNTYRMVNPNQLRNINIKLRFLNQLYSVEVITAENPFHSMIKIKKASCHSHNIICCWQYAWKVGLLVIIDMTVLSHHKFIICYYTDRIITLHKYEFINNLLWLYMYQRVW